MGSLNYWNFLDFQLIALLNDFWEIYVEKRKYHMHLLIDHSTSNWGSDQTYCTMEYIVDFQSFRRSTNLFQIKELAIVPLQDILLPILYLFKSPCKWSRLLQEEQKINKWLEKNFHGIPWNSGSVSFSCHIRILQESLKNATRIYVKGLEKKKWLEEVVPGKYIIDLDELHCPSLKKLEKIKRIFCHHHSSRKNAACAVKNAYSLRKWLISKQNEQIVAEEDDGVDLNYPIGDIPHSTSKHAEIDYAVMSMYN